MDVVFFVYGLAFVLLGVVIAVLPKRHSEYALARFIGLLAGFGLLHGLLEWTDLWRIVKGDGSVVPGLRLALLVTSFGLLFEFARRLLRAALPPSAAARRLLGPGIYVVPVAVMLALTVAAGDPLAALAASTRYTLGFLGAMGVAVGLPLYYRACVAPRLEADERRSVRRHFLLGAVAFAAYALLAGLVVQAADFVPADRLNDRMFLAALGVPVQVLRAACAVLAAIAVGNILCIFHFEGRARLERAVAELRGLNESLERRVADEVEKNRDKDRLLFEQERLAAMGETVHHLAHHWRQPINALSLLLANLRDDFDEQVLTRERLNHSMATANRLVRGMSNTIDEFRRFFREDPAPGPFSLADAVADVRGLLGPSLAEHGITLEQDIECDLTVTGFAREFARALLGIVGNAKEAIVERRVAPGRIRLSLHQERGAAVLRVADNGGGIEPELLPRVFDPYVTTKAGGIGLGLYAASVIIGRAGGSVEAQNREGGAEVVLTLPLQRDGRVAAAAERPGERVAGTT